MAKIEDLVKRISDEKLRDEIAAEVRELKKHKQFGLVFEEHLPEMLRLPKVAIRVGNLVVQREAPGNNVWRVISIKGKNATCRQPINPSKYDAEKTTEFPLADLVLVVSFGEPIYPVLTPVDRVARGGPDKPWHILINADNYHALQLLLYTYERKVDVIYIDPPYNTGARDWKYNNDYVDQTDAWRHSKWLSMLKKRLTLAKRLLKPSGVLIVTIDEHEVHHLGALLEDLFSAYSRQIMTIVINEKGVAQGRLSRVEEYAFFCFGPDAKIPPQNDDLLAPDRKGSKTSGSPRWERLLRGGTNSRRADRKQLFFPVYVDPSVPKIIGFGETLPFEQEPKLEPKDETRVAWPFRTDKSLGNWRVSPGTLTSFRKAIDHTLIAQLVGRMIRTPLARRISYEMLNTVELYLPHYDRANLEKILEELRNPDAEDRPATEVTTERPVSYERNKTLPEAFEVLKELKSAVFSNPSTLSPVRRLLRMAFFLTGDKLDEDAYERERDDLVKILLRHRETRWKDKEDWASVIRETGEVELQQFIIGLGKMELPEAAVRVRAELAPENVEGLFREAQRRIGPGTDVHMTFWKQAEQRTDPLLAKLELYALSGDASMLKELNEHADRRFAALESTNRRKVRDELKAKRRGEYRKLQQAGRDFAYLDWELPEEILEKPGGDFFEHHLYCNDAGRYQARLNSWETRVLSLWMSRTDFVGWLRNPPSKERSFCVPYEHGGWRRSFPDLIVLRREGKALVVDILEPHRANEDDTFAKAKGLAEYAETYGSSFGRIMMLKVEGTGEKAVILGFDVNVPATRKKALSMRSNEDVQGLFRALE